MYSYFSLAKELKMTVSEMLNKMTSEEYIYWVAYFQLEKEEIEKERMRNETKNNVRSR
jgi:desulfoferrodoxin (superoxide reductase-like protein)